MGRPIAFQPNFNGELLISIADERRHIVAIFAYQNPNRFRLFSFLAQLLKMAEFNIDPDGRDLRLSFPASQYCFGKLREVRLHNLPIRTISSPQAHQKHAGDCHTAEHKRHAKCKNHPRRNVTNFIEYFHLLEIVDDRHPRSGKHRLDTIGQVTERIRVIR